MRAAGLGGLGEQAPCFGDILPAADAIGIAAGQIDHGLVIAGGRRLFVIGARLLDVRFDTCAFLVEQADTGDGAWEISGKQGVDVLVNYTGGDTWVPSLRTLAKHGRLLTCGATAGFDPRTDIRYIWRREVNIIGANGWTRQDLESLEECR